MPQIKAEIINDFVLKMCMDSLIEWARGMGTIFSKIQEI